MRINNNIMAMNTFRQYSVNSGNAASSTEKLSSGYRINRAGDDAAGLAISEKMRAQIRGLNMASKNSEDAISLVQTAEGALTETHSILQRMRELSTQSSSDTNDSSVVDRDALNEEFQALKSEINDISNKTAFNGKKLLDGSLGSATTVAAASDIQSGFQGVTEISATGFVDSEADADGTDYAISVSYTATAADEGTYTFSYGGTDITVADDFTSAQDFELDFGDGKKVSVKLAAGRTAPTVGAGVDTNFGTGDDVLTAAGDMLGGAFSGANLTLNVKGTGATIQTGANAGDELQISIDNMGANALGLDTYSAAAAAVGGATTGNAVDLLSQTNASSAIESVNTAINTVSTQRSKLGAYQNRLQHKINNLDTSSENLSAAESRIRDLDMAKEMTTYTKNNILVQASTAMLAQANSAPQGVLQLLQ